MKLEHKKQSVAPLGKFVIRQGRYTIFAIALIALSVLIGTAGYHHFAAIGWMDSFHSACLILTGMGPVVEMKTEGAKLFDSFYALYSGVAFLSVTAVFFAPMVHRVMHILHVDEGE